MWSTFVGVFYARQIAAIKLTGARNGIHERRDRALTWIGVGTSLRRSVISFVAVRFVSVISVKAVVVIGGGSVIVAGLVLVVIGLSGRGAASVVGGRCTLASANCVAVRVAPATSSSDIGVAVVVVVVAGACVQAARTAASRAASARVVTASTSSSPLSLRLLLLLLGRLLSSFGSLIVFARHCLRIVDLVVVVGLHVIVLVIVLVTILVVIVLSIIVVVVVVAIVGISLLAGLSESGASIVVVGLIFVIVVLVIVVIVVVVVGVVRVVVLTTSRVCIRVSGVRTLLSTASLRFARVLFRGALIVAVRKLLGLKQRWRRMFCSVAVVAFVVIRFASGTGRTFHVFVLQLFFVGIIFRIGRGRDAASVAHVTA